MGDLSKASDMDLMLHMDGEERLAAGTLSAEEQAKLKGLRQVSEMLRTHAELELDDACPEGVPSEFMWSAITSSTLDSKVEAQQSAPRSERVQSKTETPDEPRAPDGFMHHVSQWLGGWSGPALGACVGAAAVFAVMALGPGHDAPIEASRETPEIGTSHKGTVGGANPDAIGAVAVDFKLESQAPEVEHLEVYDGQGMVLTIPGKDGETAVIWISENSEVEGQI